MKIDKEYKPMTFEEILEDPELSHFHEVIHYLEKTPFKEMFPQKYEMSVQDLAFGKLLILFKENPNRSLKDIISVVINTLPEDISSTLLLKMTPFIVDKWEKLSNQAVEKTSEWQHA